MSSVLERNIQIELYRIIQNIVAQKFVFDDIEITSVRFEPTINGRPDLVIEAIDKGKKLSLLVIETKRKVPFIDRKFDPYSKDVIKQASGYAVDLGAPYFATCNGEVLVLFDTFTAGVPLPQRKLKHYKVSFDEKFAKTLLEEVCRFRRNIGKWLELDDVFLQRLRTFHNFITPFMLDSLNRQLRSEPDFREEYIRWLKSQLFEYSPEMNERIAEQLAYMLMNRLTFYKTLETQIPALPRLTKIETEDPKKYSERLREVFDKVCKDVDYEAIFEPHPVLDRFILPKTLIYTLNDFIEELGTYNLSRIQSDVIGRVYEELIPEVERHRLGQFYTPPPIIELIIEMCIESPDDVVLDPACGSGGFLVKAYHKLKDLKKKENPFSDDAKLHEEILNQLWGIDINPFPAQLTSINLAVRNLRVPSRKINLVVSDFFKVKFSTNAFHKEFDVVVTNPPYTRQEEMEYKDQTREEALTYSDGSKISLDARAGIYAYFLTHGAKFIKQGGKMGYITSNTWLDVAFGEGLKKFLLDHFKILAVIEHDAGVFEKAIVDTCIPILEKAEGASFEHERKANIVKFFRIKKSMDIKDIITALKTLNEDLENEKLRLVCVKQKELEPKEKWGKFLRAPSIYFKLLKNPKMTKLGKIAKVKYGLKTGAVDFFILSKEQAREWGIEKRYLRPLIYEPSELHYIDVTERDITKHILMVHDSEDELRGTNVLEYIRHGEKTEIAIKKGTAKGQTVIGYQNLRTLKSRHRWYDIGKRDIAPIISCVFVRDRIINIWNKANAVATNNFHEIYPRKPDYVSAILAFLNSTIGELMVELEGRQQGGGLLQIMTYEREQIPVINPEKLTDLEKGSLTELVEGLGQAQRDGKKELEKEIKNKIDSLFFDILKLKSKEREQISDGLKYVRNLRTGRKGIDVLVKTSERWKPSPKRKVRRKRQVEPSKRLDSWVIGVK